MTRMASTLSVFAAVLFLGLAPTPEVWADPIQATYSTEGSIETTGINGPPDITFQGVSDGALTSGQPFDLGKFVVGTLPAGTTTRYMDVPFQITFRENTVNGAVPSPNDTPIILGGWLSGTISGGPTPQFSGKYDFFTLPLDPPAAVSSLPLLTIPFHTGNLLNDLYLTNDGNSGQPIQGELIYQEVVPEPTSLAVFAFMTALLACRWRVNTHTRHSGEPANSGR